MADICAVLGLASPRGVGFWTWGTLVNTRNGWQGGLVGCFFFSRGRDLFMYMLVTVCIDTKRNKKIIEHKSVHGGGVESFMS